MIDPQTIEEFARTLEQATDIHVGRALGSRMCCSGDICGCQGVTVGEYLAYQLRQSCGLPPDRPPAACPGGDVTIEVGSYDWLYFDWDVA